ncbi:alpha-mannosidase [Cohnella abietis]|uniref:Alpha-mannosidase n=1 Tax=Cohnella abietis TaxID=2507935 RepID=A0A3T1CZN9_9BACL|nr:glycoside hydrolase family 38 C-terminal domain-containing protein [Cohnella abietis]BBI31306.1 alpha-mannosidase [Cohnella abietis]
MQSREWLYHIEKWLREKENHLYRTVQDISFQYYLVNSWLPYEKAVQGSFGPIAVNTQWGIKWQYGWFKGTVVIPPEATGERIELKLNLGGESTIYVNGKLAGAQDLQHNGVTLTRSAVPGQIFEIVAEAYSGHDRELPIYGQSRIVILNEELYQFYIDLNALFQLRNSLDSSSLRVSEIDNGFLKLIALLDWNAVGIELEQLARQGREILRPLLECVNGSTAPKLFMMGQSHLDIAWLWPIEETKRKIARTLSNQLALLDEYPEYRYVQSQPYLFHMVKDLYPELYGRIKHYVSEGRIIPEGGMWVEPDTNIPSGESLIRQFLYGKQFFRGEFGVDNKMLWLPDVFGYSGNLPQIMRKCGIQYFASVKMYQIYDNIVDPFPYNTFTWEGIDGSTVPVHLLDYGPFPNPADVSYVNFQWNERIQKEGISTRLVQFGYGDGGGGANRDDLESLRRMGNLEGVPQTVISSPLDYFEDLQERGMPDAHYFGELYYPAHRGTLTSQAKMKKGNRAVELALREAEVWGALSSMNGNLSYPQEDLDELWRRLLLLQFHDILPGTSITRVHEEAEREFDAVLQSANQLSLLARQSLTDGSSEGITFFNSLPWERTAIVELPDTFEGATDVAGARLRVQPQQGMHLAQLTIPAMGYVSITPASSEVVTNTLRVTNEGIENQWLRISLNEWGEITSIWDKEANSEWANGLCNQFLMYRDQPSSYDAWELDRRYASSAIPLQEKARITVIAEGPLVATIRVERSLNQSHLVQDICLEVDSRRIEFRTRLDWKEKHKLLKVGFDVNLHSNEVLNEIQFGYVKRPNHFSRPHDSDRYEVSQHKWSTLVEGDRCFSLLNDCKYGLNVNGKQMNLTLLRSPTYPDERADEGQHEFTYALHVWNEGFTSNPVVREAYELNCPVLSVSGSVEQPFGLLQCNRANIIVDSIKMAQDYSGDWIARVYEAKGTSTNSVLSLGVAIQKAWETDMLEEVHVKDLTANSNGVALSLAPFEVKTIRFKPLNSK